MYIFHFIRRWFYLLIGYRTVVKRPSRIPGWVWWIVEALVVIGVLVLLYLFNRENLPAVENLPAPIRRVFFPLIGLLVYFAIRLVIFILKQIPAQASQYPDIDEAFQRGMDALAEAGINLGDTPLFLVVGMKKAAEREFSKVGFVSGPVRVGDDHLPVHWYGSGEALWVTVPGISAICAQAARPIGTPVGSAAPAAGPAIPVAGTLMGGAPAANVLAGLAGGGAVAAPAAAPAAPRFSTLGGNVAAAEVLQQVEHAEGEGAGETQLLPPTTAASGRLSADQREECQNRLEYFVSLLRNARYPVCPVNGILLVVPYMWATNADVSMLSDSAASDMRTLQNTLGVKCTCVTVFSEIEQSEGLREFINRHDRKGWEANRIGCGFPMLTHLDSDEVGNLHDWLFNTFEHLIYPLFQQKMGEPGNQRLVRFLEEFRKSKQHFIRVLRNAFPTDVEDRFYLGGLYFAAGAHQNKAPFVSSVLAKLLEQHEETLAWTKRSLVEDRRDRRISTVIMVIVVGLVVLNAGLIVKLVERSLD